MSTTIPSRHEAATAEAFRLAVITYLGQLQSMGDTLRRMKQDPETLNFQVDGADLMRWLTEANEFGAALLSMGAGRFLARL